MPETAMDEDDRLGVRKVEIGSPGQVLSVLEELYVQGAEQVGDHHLRLRIFPAHGLHDLSALVLCEYVRHAIFL